MFSVISESFICRDRFVGTVRLVEIAFRPECRCSVQDRKGQLCRFRTRGITTGRFRSLKRTFGTPTTNKVREGIIVISKFLDSLRSWSVEIPESFAPSPRTPV